MVKKETYIIKGYNVAALNATKHFAIQEYKAAEQRDNIPHNAMVIANRDTTCTLFVYLDNFSDQDNPDYIIHPLQTMVLLEEEGVSFTTVWIKNTHAVSNIAAKAINYKISTVKEVGEIYNGFA